MLNLSLGAFHPASATDHILTGRGARGHALFGPYETLPAGRYAVEFSVALPAGSRPADDFVCAVLDVVADQGRTDIAFDFVFVSEIGEAATALFLTFAIDAPRELEYRVHVSGALPLIVGDRPKLIHLDHRSAPPVRIPPARSELLTDRTDMLKHLYDHGVAIGAVDGELVLSVRGIRFNARTYDDVNFVDELFFRSAYNFMSANDACVIDVGMNIGLASLLFAAMPQVREVHAFEPFAATYDRALRNLRLNTALADAIHAHNFGLAAADRREILNVHDNGNSGGMAVREHRGGRPVEIEVRDAAAVLRPIIASARARGLEVIAKIDCEGSEFDIIGSLDRGDVLKDIRGLMVEWHRVFEGRDQSELIRPLLAAGYLVFDLTPPEGNGFFYAVRAG